MRSWIWICAILLLAAPGARAETPDQAAIRAALTGWMADFNAGRQDRVCDLFSPELRYDYRGFPERGYRELCELLHRSLSKQDRKFAYSVDIREILVFGDLAIVRLTWTLRVTDMAPAAAATTEEPGLDVFRRQADGSWKIIRYLGYEE
ncbi:MAG TPA: nuclear transport factor 2 family protein [Dongiaceae bacterium]|nr:nuclear transport factor 2 family protein [Dongiaceae bacterium]